MKWFKNIFRRREKQAPQPLRIEGIPPAPMTAEPDDAELAAQALLEHMCEVSGKGAKKDLEPETGKTVKPETGIRDASYYRQLATRIRLAYDAATLRTMRFVSFCEQKLQDAGLPKEGPGSLTLLEVELMKRIDTIEREGGDLKRRWQHCLAEVTVRLMQTGQETADDTGQEQEQKTTP